MRCSQCVSRLLRCSRGPLIYLGILGCEEGALTLYSPSRLTIFSFHIFSSRAKKELVEEQKKKLSETEKYRESMNHRKEITLKISTTTGKNFEIKIDENGLVDELRWQVARKVQTPRDRLTLIHKEK